MLNVFINNLPISKEAKAALYQHWIHESVIKRQDFLIRNDQIDRNLYFIEKGTFKIFYPLEEQEAIVGFGYENNILCDYVCLVKGIASPYYIQALSAGTLKSIHYQDFKNIIDRYPSMKDCWQGLTEQALLGRIEREIDLLTPSPKLRYQRLMDRSPQVFQHISLKYIAAYLRMTPETLSRLRSSIS